MLSLGKEHHWNLRKRVGSVLTHCLQLDVKAREAMLTGTFLLLAVQKVCLEGEDCSSKGLNRRNVCDFSHEACF